MKSLRFVVITAMFVMSFCAAPMAAMTSSNPSEPGGSGAAKGPAQANQRSTSRFSSMIAYGSFQLGDEDRFGPMLILQYSPAHRSMPAIDLFAGVLVQTGSSGIINQDEYIPVASVFAPYYSPYSDYRNDNLYRMPHYSIGIGFLGADLTFYLAEGDVRPYVGIGGTLAFWTYSRHMNGTFAPDAKAGLSVQVSSGFSGFAEVRRMFDVPNLVGLDVPRFGGVTAGAIGVSFAPRLR
jgi:hypothetical protein